MQPVLPMSVHTSSLLSPFENTTIVSLKEQTQTREPSSLNTTLKPFSPSTVSALTSFNTTKPLSHFFNTFNNSFFNAALRLSTCLHKALCNFTSPLSNLRKPPFAANSNRATASSWSSFNLTFRHKSGGNEPSSTYRTTPTSSTTFFRLLTIHLFSLGC